MDNPASAAEKAIRRSIIWIGGFHLLLVLILFLGPLSAYMNGSTFSMGNMAGTLALYQEGGWFEQMQYRLTNFLALRSEVIFVIPLNVVLFLTGISLMRKGLFGPDEAGKKLRRTMMKFGLWAGLPLNLLLFVPGGLFDFPVWYAFAPILSIGYLSVIIWDVEKVPHFRLWGWLERAGKMSLSCYVLQNVLCSILFTDGVSVLAGS